jgi:hypothetical protein
MVGSTIHASETSIVDRIARDLLDKKKEIQFPNENYDSESLTALLYEANAKTKYRDLFKFKGRLSGGNISLTVEYLDKPDESMLLREFTSWAYRTLQQHEEPGDLEDIVYRISMWFAMRFEVAAYASADMHQPKQTYSSGVGYCQAFAQLAQMLFDNSGIPSVVMTGTLDGVPHMWNIIKVNDKYYNCDMTAVVATKNVTYALMGPDERFVPEGVYGEIAERNNYLFGKVLYDGNSLYSLHNGFLFIKSVNNTMWLVDRNIVGFYFQDGILITVDKDRMEWAYNSQFIGMNRNGELRRMGLDYIPTE